MKRTPGFFGRLAAMTGLVAAAAELKGIDLLRDIFSSVNNRVNGYEHVLARRRGKRHQPSTLFLPKQRHGAQERLRRQHQLAGAKYLLRGRHIHTGVTALVQVFPGSPICKVQMNDLASPQAYGWHEAPAKLWEVVPVGCDFAHGFKAVK